MSLYQTVAKQIPLSLPRRSLPRRWRRSWDGFTALLLLAAVLTAGLLLLTPAYLLVRTLESGATAVDLLTKPSTIATLGRSLWLSATVTLASIVVAVPLAWLTTSTDLPGRRFWAVATALPLVLPSYVVAFLLVSLLGPKGLLQQWLFPFTGIERFPEIYGFPGAFIALTLMSYPYVLLTARAALQRMDPALLEAARSLGLNGWQTFWRVTLPHLRPSLLAGGLLVALYVLRDFGAVAMMRYNTFTRIIYIQYQTFTGRSLAAVLALALVLLVLVILLLEMRARGRARYDRRAGSAPRVARPVRLGRWRWPALIYAGTVVFGALLLPALGLLYWAARGLAQGETLGVVWQSAFNSVTVSAAAAVAALLAALPVALLSVRRPSRFSQGLERLTYAGFALPGIVIALAFVFFGARYAPALYQTLPLLVAAYVVLFAPQAVGAARASLLQAPVRLEEAGRSLGRSPFHVFGRITLPLLRPGVLAGWALVFLTCMKELPAALILSPLGYRTLATAVWANISEAFFARAAIPALLLILLSSIPLAILTLRDK